MKRFVKPVSLLIRLPFLRDPTDFSVREIASYALILIDKASRQIHVVDIDFSDILFLIPFLQ